MAMVTEAIKQEVGIGEVEGKIEEEEEKWVKYYSSKHRILLVGEGDFSFSLCLATAFGSASNIFATSLHPYDTVTKQYKKAKSNLETLRNLGGSIIHGVDATNMKVRSDLRKWKFDRIIFNFPHAGFCGKEDNDSMIDMHKQLVHGFFRNACDMLRANGEVHVNHKTTAPFSRWDLPELANMNALLLIGSPDFDKEDYPGYNNKRGEGKRCDEPFPLGECSTFMFRFSRTVKKFMKSKTWQVRETPIQSHQNTSFGLRIPHDNITFEPSYPMNIQRDCLSNFHGNEAKYPIHESFQFGNLSHPKPNSEGVFNNFPMRTRMPLTGDNIQREVTRVNPVNQQYPGMDNFRHPPYMDSSRNMSDIRCFRGLPLTADIRREGIFTNNGFFNNVAADPWRVAHDVENRVYHVIGNEIPERTINGDLHVRERRRRMSQVRRVRRLLMDYGNQQQH